MPRPQKAKNERRSRQIIFRLTEEEYAQVQSLAQRAGKRPNELARMILKRRKGSIVIQAANHADPILIQQVQRIGQNLNQLVHNAHMFKRVSPLVEPLCREIREVVLKAIEKRIDG